MQIRVTQVLTQAGPGITIQNTINGSRHLKPPLLNLKQHTESMERMEWKMEWNTETRGDEYTKVSI